VLCEGVLEAGRVAVVAYPSPQLLALDHLRESPDLLGPELLESHVTASFARCRISV